MENKYGAFQQTTEDRKFMSMYYNSIIASRKFKENLNMCKYLIQKYCMYV